MSRTARNIILLLSFLWTPFAFSKTLVIEFSDSHSAYDKFPNLIRTISALAQDFQSKNPGDPVVVLANGDIAGASRWTEGDAGMFSFTMLSGLAERAHVVFVTGNHEGFDFVASPFEKGHRPNELFLVQARQFLVELARSSHPSKILAANLVPSEEAKELFTAYQDIPLSDGQKLRVIGQTLPDLQGSSSYDPESPLQVFSQVRNHFDVAVEQLVQAAKDGVTQVILACHNDFAVVRDLGVKLLEWKKKNESSIPGLEKIRIPLVTAGHDHQIHHEISDGKTHLIDSGDHAAFSAVVIGDAGEVEGVKHYTTAEQEKFSGFSNVNDAEKALIEKLKVQVEETNRTDRAVVGVFEGTQETKKDLKAGRTQLGTRLADTLVTWVRESLEKVKTPEFTDVIGFFNSNSYRRMVPVEKGPLSYGDLKTMIPFRRDAKLIVAEGLKIQEAFERLRKERLKRGQVEGSSEPTQGDYTPQISSNLREVESFTLQIKNSKGEWHPLQPSAKYALVMDDFLGINGYGVPEFEELLSSARWTYRDAPETRDIIRKYLFKTSSCGDWLKPKK